MPIKCEVVSVPAIKSVKNSSINWSFDNPYSVSINFLSISIFKRLPYYCYLSSNFLVIESFTIYLKIKISWLTSRSTANNPSFKISGPNIKLLNVLSWIPTLATNLYKNTES
jgi:hypothetical protein